MTSNTMIIFLSIATIIGALLSIFTKYLQQREKKESLNKLFSEENATANHRDRSSQHYSYNYIMMDRTQLRVKKISSGTKVLITFAIIVLILGTITILRYWSFFEKSADNFLFGIWLFLTMIAGMFVQVIVSNYNAGKRLFDVSTSQLVFPLLFSLFVFYPIWTISASAKISLFSLHAAFLNGYFWESTVSSTRLPPP